MINRKPHLDEFVSSDEARVLHRVIRVKAKPKVTVGGNNFGGKAMATEPTLGGEMIMNHICYVQNKKAPSALKGGKRVQYSEE